jgi:hypothetical protein
VTIATLVLVEGCFHGDLNNRQVWLPQLVGGETAPWHYQQTSAGTVVAELYHAVVSVLNLRNIL